MVHAMRVPKGADANAEARGNPPFPEIRHCFFDMGNDRLIGFFEMPKGAKKPVDRNGIAAMQHVSFALPREDHHKLHARLDKHGIYYLGPIKPLEGLLSTYFYDNNGIRLEVTSHDKNSIDPKVIEDLQQTPDEAMDELRGLHGDNEWLDRVKAYMA